MTYLPDASVTTVHLQGIPSPQQEPCIKGAHSLLLLPLATPDLLPVSASLPILGASHTWNLTLGAFLCLPTYICLIISEIAFLLFEKEITDRLETRCKKKPF